MDIPPAGVCGNDTVHPRIRSQEVLEVCNAIPEGAVKFRTESQCQIAVRTEVQRQTYKDVFLYKGSPKVSMLFYHTEAFMNVLPMGRQNSPWRGH